MEGVKFSRSVLRSFSGVELQWKNSYKTTMETSQLEM